MLLIRQDSHPELSEGEQVIAKNMDMMHSMFEQMGSEAHSLRQQMRDQLITQLKQMGMWEDPKLPKDYYFYHCNHLGLPDALTDKAGQVVWAAEYDPWGNLKNEHNPENLKQSIRLPGQYHDTETGLYYNRHRYYDPALGSYINQDPIGLNSGEPNFYAYPKNPLQGVDPLGLVYGLGNGPYGQSNMTNRNAAEHDIVNDITKKAVEIAMGPPDTGDVTREILQHSRGPSPAAQGDHAAFGACYNNARIKMCMDRLDEYEAAAKADKSIGKYPLIQIGGEAFREFGVKRSLCEQKNECDLSGYLPDALPDIWPPKYESMPGEIMELPEWLK